jgi:hypothetical protein
MKGRHMICKEFRRKWSWPNFKVPVVSQLGTEENHESQDSQNPDFNLGPSKYEAGALTTQP